MSLHAPIIDNRISASPCLLMDSIYETLRVLRAARALVGLSQEQVAERAGVSRRTVVRIETGGKGIAVEALEKVRVSFERAGVEFIPSTVERGPGIALRRQKNNDEK